MIVMLGHSMTEIMAWLAYRRISQVAFILFIFLMPVLNILRFDSATRELIIFGQVWGLGLKEGFYADRSAAGALQVALSVFPEGHPPLDFCSRYFPFARLPDRQALLRLVLSRRRAL
jgi:hypothetical protein